MLKLKDAWSKFHAEPSESPSNMSSDPLAWILGDWHDNFIVSGSIFSGEI